MISSGAIPMKGVPKTVTVVGKPGIGTGAPGKLIVAVTGCGGTRIPSKGKCSVIPTVGAEGTEPCGHQDRRIQHGCAVEEAV